MWGVSGGGGATKIKKKGENGRGEKMGKEMELQKEARTRVGKYKTGPKNEGQKRKHRPIRRERLKRGGANPQREQVLLLGVVQQKDRS